MTFGSRVVIIGSSGSGKSTLAQEIAQRVGAPAIDLDHIHWEANRPFAEAFLTPRRFPTQPIP